MPLVFDDRNLLTPGIHDATWVEVEQHFGSYQHTDRRMRLFERLRAYATAVQQAGCGASMLVDGSFVMKAVDEPDDIDLIVVLPADWDVDADLKPYQYNLLSRKRTRKEFGIEVFPVRPGSVAEQEWIVFFSQVREDWCVPFGWPINIGKGIVRVAL